MSFEIPPEIFTDEAAAKQWLVESRWPDGIFCPHCFCTDVRTTAFRRMMFRCGCCRRFFSVTTGTSLHSSKIPYTTLTLAFHLMAAAQDGIDISDLIQVLSLSDRASWELAWKIRESWDENEGEDAEKNEGEDEWKW